MRKDITTFTDLQLHKDSQKKFLFEVTPAQILTNVTAGINPAYLKAYYRFETGTLTVDSSSYARTLTKISDPAETTGKFGGGVVFGADDAYSAVDHADWQPLGNFSILIWVKHDGILAASGCCFSSFSYISATPSLSGWWLGFNDGNGRAEGQIAFYTAQAGTGYNYAIARGTTNICDGNWHFVVGTWNGISLKLYVDGMLDGTLATKTGSYAPVYLSPNYPKIGCDTTNGAATNFFHGSLDEVALLNGIALSAGEVLSLYNNNIEILSTMAVSPLPSTPWLNELYSDTDFTSLAQNETELTRVNTLADCVATAGTCFLGNRSAIADFVNLKAFYKFESGLLTLDSSFMGHTLLAIGDPAEDAGGAVGGCVDLDTNDAYKLVSGESHADFQPTGAFTVGGWVRKPTGGTGSDFIATCYNYEPGPNLWGWALFVNCSTRCTTFAIYTDGTGGAVSITTNTALAVDTWTHIAATYDGTHLKIYFNGVSDATEVDGATPLYHATNMHVRIGCGAYGSGSGTDSLFFYGKLDEVFFINGTALSDAEIANIYAGNSLYSDNRRLYINPILDTDLWDTTLLLRFQQFFATHSDCVFQPDTPCWPGGIKSASYTTITPVGSSFEFALPDFCVPTAHYRFSTGASVTDSSGNGHTLVAISGPVENANGRFGGCIDLGGDDAYALSGMNSHIDFQPSGSFTIGAWVKKDINIYVDSVIFSSYVQTVGAKKSGIRLLTQTGGVVTIESSTNTGSTKGIHYESATSLINIYDGEWHFVIGTWNANTNLLSITVDNNSSVTTFWNHAPVFATTNYVRIGAFRESSDLGFFYGSIDEVFFINGTALTSAQISELYIYNNRAIFHVTGHPFLDNEYVRNVWSRAVIVDPYLLNFVTPKAYYCFESGALTTDSSGNSHTLTDIGIPPTADSSGAHGGCVSLNTAAIDGTGGTITHVGNKTIHTFLYTDTFNPSVARNVEVLVVAGGGGGGLDCRTLVRAAGGGGAGGVLYSASMAVTATNYSVTVGIGGVAGSFIGGDDPRVNGGNGGNSIFSTLTAIGGGGGQGNTLTNYEMSRGGSGGGRRDLATEPDNATTGQGYRGGKGYASADFNGGGGGGAGAVGGDGTASTTGAGGAGVNYSISGASVGYAGGGGSHGGSGDGVGATAYGGGNAGVNGTDGKGGGGGANRDASGAAGAGGSGVVIISYETYSAYSIVDHADFQPLTSFSIIAWIKSNDTATYRGIFSSWAYAASKIAGIRMYTDITTGYVALQSGRNSGEVENTDYKTLLSTINVCDGDWHCIVGVWDGYYLKLYIDNVLNIFCSWFWAPVFQTPNYVRVGCLNDTGVDKYFFKGQLDEVAFLSNKALSNAEINDIYIGGYSYSGNFWLKKEDSDHCSLTSVKDQYGNYAVALASTTGSGQLDRLISPYPVIYKPLLKSIPAFISRDDDIVNSGSEFAIGSLSLLNGKNVDYSNGGPLDYCLQNYIYTRARCRCLIGGESLPYTEYKPYWCGQIDTATLQPSEVVFDIKDNLQALDYKYPADTYDYDYSARYMFEPDALLIDSSGNDHTLSAVGSPTIDSNGGVTLSGSDAYIINDPDSADFKPTTPFSIQVRIKIPIPIIAQSVIFQSGNSSDEKYWSLYINADYLGFFCQISHTTTANAYIYTVNTPLIDGEWHTLKGSWSGTTLSFFIDGRPYQYNQSAAAMTGLPVYPSPNKVSIGYAQASADKFFIGSIDDVRLWIGGLNPILEGVVIPVIYGTCRNIKPAEIDQYNWIFNCASHALYNLTAVREAGIDISANITVLNLATATFTLYPYADGRTITCDVAGKHVNEELIDTYGQIGLELLQAAPSLTADDIDSKAFLDFDAVCPYKLGVYITGQPLRETLSVMNKSVLARIIKGRDGKFRPQKFSLPAEDAEFDFDYTSITDLSIQILQDKLYYKIRVGYEKNWCVQPDTAAGGVAEREDWTHTYKYVDTVNVDTKFKYKCEDTLIVETLLNKQEDAEAVAAEYLTLLQQPWVEIEFKSSMVPYTLVIGDTISVDDDRFFDSTSRFIITGIVDDPVTANVTITARAPCDGTMTLI